MFMQKRTIVFLFTLIILGTVILSGCATAAPSPTPTKATTPTVLPTTAIAPSPTPTATRRPVPTATPSPTPVPAPSATPTPATTAAATAAPAATEPAQSSVSFARDIAPIFQERCVKCHAGSGAPRGLHLDTYENVMKGSEFRPVVVPGDPEASELVRRIRGDSTPRMPFDGPPFLSDEQINTIIEWIKEGAANN